MIITYNLIAYHRGGGPPPRTASTSSSSTRRPRTSRPRGLETRQAVSSCWTQHAQQTRIDVDPKDLSMKCPSVRDCHTRGLAKSTA